MAEILPIIAGLALLGGAAYVSTKVITGGGGSSQPQTSTEQSSAASNALAGIENALMQLGANQQALAQSISAIQSGGSGASTLPPPPNVIINYPGSGNAPNSPQTATTNVLQQYAQAGKALPGLSAQATSQLNALNQAESNNQAFAGVIAARNAVASWRAEGLLK